MVGTYTGNRADWRSAEELLGLVRPYSESDVNKAYRKAMLHCHPDTRWGKADAQSATEQAARINWAREVLRERVSRGNEQASHSCGYEAKVPDSRRKAAGSSWQPTGWAHAGSAVAAHAGVEHASYRRIDGFAAPAPKDKPAGGNGAFVAGLLSFVCLLDCVLHVVAFSVFGVGQDYSMLTLDFGYATRVLWTYLLEPPAIALSALAACVLARHARAEAGGVLPSRARIGRFLGRFSVPAFCASFILLNAWI